MHDASQGASMVLKSLLRHASASLNKPVVSGDHEGGTMRSRSQSHFLQVNDM